MSWLPSRSFWLTKRAARVMDPDAPMPPRRLLAYFLAMFVPFAGRMGAGFGMLVLVYVVGIMAAIAIPAYDTYTVKANDGSAPTATSGPDVAVAVYRAYDTLADWESQQENTLISDSNVNPDPDLDGTDTILMVACYADGNDSTAVTINGWTTGPDNYIRIYTPVSSSEVGTSQRHNGTWDTSAYRLEVTPTADWQNNIEIGGDQYVRIDGLQFYRTSDYQGACVIHGFGLGSAELRISNSIFKGCRHNSV